MTVFPTLAALRVPDGDFSSVGVLGRFPQLQRFGGACRASPPSPGRQQGSRRSSALAAMRAGAAAWGGPPDPPSCGVTSGHPVLLLAVLGLLSIPVAHGEYGAWEGPGTPAWVPPGCSGAALGMLPPSLGLSQTQPWLLPSLGEPWAIPAPSRGGEGAQKGLLT